MKKIVFRMFVCLLPFCLILGGCGDSGKDAPPKAPEQAKSTTTQAPQAVPAGTKVTAPQATTAGTSKSAPMSCYDVGVRTGRCAAKTMSGSPCDPADEIPVPPECKGTAEMEKGLKEGRKSVF